MSHSYFIFFSVHFLFKKLMPGMRCTVVALLLSVLIGTAVADGLWLFSAYEGMTSTMTLSQQWGGCGGQYSFMLSPPVLDGLTIPNFRFPQLQYTPPFGSAGQQSQLLAVYCNIFSQVGNGTMYFVVRPSSQTTPVPTTTTTTAAPPTPTLAPGQTFAPTTSTTTPSPTPAPTLAPPTTPVPTPAGAVTCSAPANIITTIQTPVAVNLLTSVTNCISPSVTVNGNSTSPLFTIAADGISVSFDANASNAQQGVYVGVFGVSCGDALVCILTQYIVVTAPPVVTTEAPATPSPTQFPQCSPVYGYECYYSTLMNFSLSGLLGASVCPNGTASSFLLTAGPTANPSAFALDSSSGSFTYLAPSVLSVDAFAFYILCDQAVLCASTAYLVSSSTGPSPSTASPSTTAVPVPTNAPYTPPPTTQPLPTCVGAFSYVFYRDSNGVVLPQQGNLYTAINQNFTSCPTFGGVVLTQNANFGSVVISDAANGIFTYSVLPNTAGPLDWDNFTFVVSCTGSATASCSGTATILIVTISGGPTPAPTPVPTLSPPEYRISEQLRCTGTCSADAWKSIDTFKDGFDTTTDSTGGYSHITPRKDGRGFDEVDFYLGMESDLVMVAFTKIGNMAARFPTFQPIHASSLLNSATAAGANTAFDATCLDNQGKYGVAFSLWNWTNITALQGAAFGNYGSGPADYYQRFGGKHVDCDTFRNNACQYAPMMNPSNASGIQWRLYISGCDATWVGTASLTAIKALRFANGSSVFSLSADGKSYTGTLFTEAIKPMSWVRPAAGTKELSRPYTITAFVRNLLTSNVTTVGFVPATLQSTSPPPPTVTSPPSTQSLPFNITDNSSSTLTSDNTTGAPATTVPTPPPTSPPQLWQSLIDVQVDVAYSIASDAVTNERLYQYNILIYPGGYALPANESIFSSLYVTGVQLGSASFVSPRLSNCPQCTGTVSSCAGNGTGFADVCGSAALVSFAPTIDAAPMTCPNTTAFPQAAGVVSSVTCPQTAFNVSFYGRVNGIGSAASIGQPEGDIAVLITFSNGQTIQVNIRQEAYFTQASLKPLAASICRAADYFPVVDPVGASTPADVYTIPSSPQRYTEAMTTVDLRNLTAPAYAALPAGPATCFVPDERIFGPTDWVTVVVDALKQPNASLEYLVLAVEAKEVVPNPLTKEFIFLLQGAFPEGVRRSLGILDWKTYASFISFRSVDTSDGTTPFTFAFIPGTLLRSTWGSRQVVFTVQASIRTSSGSTLIRYRIPVSTSLTPAVRGETVATPFKTYAVANSANAWSYGGIALAFGLVGGLFLLIGALVYAHEETRGAFAEQLGTLCCAKGHEEEEPTAKQPATLPTLAREDARTASPTSTRTRKALTPAQARFMQQESDAAAQRSAGSPRTAATASPTSARAPSPRARSAPREPEVEISRRLHDVDEA